MENLQRTLKKEVEIEGIGIHTGEHSSIVIHPAKENTGIVFKQKNVYIEASIDNVISTSNATSIGKDGAVVLTVEHILAALHKAKIDNAIVEFKKGKEVPILDGSAIEFYNLFKNNYETLKEERKYLFLKNLVRVEKNGSFIVAKPSSTLSITFEGDFQGFHKIYKLEENDDRFLKARTFCFDWEIEYLKNKNLGKGGSLANTVVLGKEKIYNKEGMRFKEELPAHKALDIYGDIFLLGAFLLADIYSYKGGHSLNIELAKEIKGKSVLRECPTCLAV